MNPPGSERLKLKHDGPLSSSAVKFNLRRYNPGALKEEDNPGALKEEEAGGTTGSGGTNSNSTEAKADAALANRNPTNAAVALAAANASCLAAAAAAATGPVNHYPQLPAERFWSPREPDWWVVAHPTSATTAGRRACP